MDLKLKDKASHLGRPCTPEDAGPLAAFMASELSSYFAGSFGGGGGP